MSSPWQKLTTISSNLKALAMRVCPSTLLDSLKRAPSCNAGVPPLDFPEVPSSVPQLLHLGLSQDCANLLHTQFVNAIQKADQILSEIYHAHAPKFLERNDAPLAGGSRAAYIHAIQIHLLTVRTQTIAKLRGALLSQAQNLVNEAHLAQGNVQASSSSATIDSDPSKKRKRQGRPTTFTPEQTFALNALLARDDQFSSEDKEYIAEKLNLTRDQVNRWFCNARARKKSGRPALRGGPSASVRTVSSDLDSTEAYQTDEDLITPVATSSTPTLNDQSPGFTNTTPGTTLELTNPTPGPNNSELTNPALEVDSLDVYLNYSAYVEPDQSADNLPHNLTAQHDQGSFTSQITSWSESVNMTAPVLSSASSVQSQVAPASVPMDRTLFPETQECSSDVTTFIDPFMDPLSFNSIQALPNFPSSAAPEFPLSNDLFPNFDLSDW